MIITMLLPIVTLTRFIATLDEDRKMFLRKDIYARFFAQAPAGQDSPME